MGNKILVVGNFYMKNIFPELLTKNSKTLKRKNLMEKRKSIIAIGRPFIMKMKSGPVVTLRYVNGRGFILHALT